MRISDVVLLLGLFLVPCWLVGGLINILRDKTIKWKKEQ